MINAQLPFLPANIDKQDPRPIKGIKHDDALFAPKRIEFRQPILIQAIPANTALDINFENKLGFDCLIRGITADIEGDDGNLIQDGTSNNYRFSYVQVIIQTLDKDTKYVLRTINIYISSYPAYVNELLLSPQYLYRIRLNQAVRSLAFTCEPVVQANPITLYPISVSEG